MITTHTRTAYTNLVASLNVLICTASAWVLGYLMMHVLAALAMGAEYEVMRVPSILIFSGPAAENGRSWTASQMSHSLPTNEHATCLLYNTLGTKNVDDKHQIDFVSLSLHLTFERKPSQDNIFQILIFPTRMFVCGLPLSTEWYLEGRSLPQAMISRVRLACLLAVGGANRLSVNGMHVLVQGAEGDQLWRAYKVTVR